MESEYTLTTDINGIKNLKSSIEYLLQVWPGSPARPAEEQEELHSLKLMLFAMTMEMVIEKQDEDESPR